LVNDPLSRFCYCDGLQAPSHCSIAVPGQTVLHNLLLFVPLRCADLRCYGTVVVGCCLD